MSVLIDSLKNVLSSIKQEITALKLTTGLSEINFGTGSDYTLITISNVIIEPKTVFATFTGSTASNTQTDHLSASLVSRIVPEYDESGTTLYLHILVDNAWGLSGIYNIKWSYK